MEDLDYMAGYTLLDKCSDERQLFVTAARNLFKSRQKSVSRVLDIGSGYGRFFDLAGKKPLEYLEFVEPNSLFYELSYAEAALHAKQFKGHRCGALSAMASVTETFDVVLLSHVLYHIPVPAWITLIEELGRRLSREGTIIVALWNSDSEAYKFTRAINHTKDVIVSETFRTECLQSRNFDVVTIKPRILLRTPRGLDVLHRFFADFSIGGDLASEHPLLDDALVDLGNAQDIYFIGRESICKDSF